MMTYNASQALPPEGYVKLNSLQEQKRIINLVSKALASPTSPQRGYNKVNDLSEASCIQPPYDTKRRAAGKISNEFSHDTSRGLGDYDEDSTAGAKKLKIRGLRNFIEKRGCGLPPSWVKEFPCRSRYHPDEYLYDLDDGPTSPKRNVEAMSQCAFHGGRCRICGVYTSNLCPSCSHCETDCSCSKRAHQYKNTDKENSMPNPLRGLPSLDTMGTTLSKAQKILQSSQNAPAQYPFSMERNEGTLQNNSPMPPHPLQPGPFASAFPQPYPYGYPYAYPPLPYMIPPPAYGYPYPLPPMGMGYPQPPLPAMAPPSSYPPFGFPYNQTIPPSQPHGPYSQNSSQPTCTSYISVNNDN